MSVEYKKAVCVVLVNTVTGQSSRFDTRWQAYKAIVGDPKHYQLRFEQYHHFEKVG